MMTHHALVNFTPRQRTILKQMLNGVEAKAVAKDLGIDIRTIHWHHEEIHRHTETGSLVSLFSWSLRHRECCQIRDLFPDALHAPIDVEAAS